MNTYFLKIVLKDGSEKFGHFFGNNRKDAIVNAKKQYKENGIAFNKIN